jgi:signal transduction histidine kinase
VKPPRLRKPSGWAKSSDPTSPVATDLPANFERLSPEMETAIFPIVQECLTNVHRNSGSKEASIRLARENGCVVLEVADVGRGLSPANNGSS